MPGLCGASLFCACCSSCGGLGDGREDPRAKRTKGGKVGVSGKAPDCELGEDQPGASHDGNKEHRHGFTFFVVCKL